ncbi:VanZ family protein [Salinisphaera sp. T31B1]|uniref:VanZ family protein n=1 Tax=Salinisphaera sp. T31B1 TaxID=727963 RepID=UPI00333F5375
MIRAFAWMAVLSAGFIVYGSLFPFEPRADGALSAAHLLATIGHPVDSLPNLLSNIVFYMPLGVFTALACRASRPIWQLIAITALGAALSLTMELAQLHVAGRLSTFADIYPNTVGTFAGVVVAILVRPWAVHRGASPAGPLAPIPIFLLAVFLAYRLFPYVPSLDLHAYWRAVQPLIVAPDIRALAICRYGVMWFAVAALLARIALPVRIPLLSLWAMGAVWAAKIVLTGSHLGASEVIGGLIALLAWQFVSRLGTRTEAGVLALALAAWIVAARLQPFIFDTQARAFGWVPFAALLNGSMSINLLSLLEKSFLYGTLMWTLVQLGMRWSIAAMGLALSLGLLGWAQTHIPGRSADITDAAIAVAMAVLLALLARPDAMPGLQEGQPPRADPRS